MKADRLLSILMWLQTNGRATARELAARLEVSERTVHRDMETLGMAGIPVVADRGYRGGWSLPEGYRSRLTGMTADEISSLLLLGTSSVVKDLGLTDSAQAAFRKLLAALPASVRENAEIARQRIHVDGAGWRPPAGSSSADAERLSIIQQAVWEERTLRILYRAVVADMDKERVVAPLGLVAKQSVWYMIAIADGDMRTYRISRLSAVTLLDERFERPDGFELAAYWEQSTERFRATLPRYPARVRVSEARWPRFAAERYVYLQGERLPVDGWIEADVEFHTLDSACGIMLSYGKHAEALEPEELRLAVRSELQALGELYGI
ncbi:helix-turn-helix transcriptional regulator [Cohnella candidum]|uniref:YafY family transcriptional regulator n=1 Tax=Cohnella candidum TaxID=2674991 RepID=A0A3G3K147_9BACL|nr:YafY family protein [Cohnella candidum]AYQ74274.1 YafY family transcriptional regulator [Cohnella candidum]